MAKPGAPTLGRILRLLALHARLDFNFLARGPGAAFTLYLSDLVMGVATVTATFLIAERFDGIGPWTRPQVIFLLGYALLVRATINGFFNFNLAQISRRVGRGQLDHTLLQPQPLWVALLTEGFAPLTGTGMLLPAVAMLVYAAVQSHLVVSPAWLALLLVDLSASIAIVMAFEYIWGSLAFWAPRAAEEINSATWRLMHQLAPFPLDGLATVALGGLLTVVPAGLVAWYPVRGLVGIDQSAPALLVPPAAAILALGLARGAFTRGLRHYRHTGSTRYLDYGHRR